MDSILIFAYYSYKDPVFQSAVLPYFSNFPNKKDYRFILITFEQQQYPLNKKEEQDVRDFLNSESIIWYRRKWHSGKLKIIKKIYDLIQSITFSLLLIGRHKIKIIYSEGFPGAILAHFISKLSGKPHIVHTFEPHADYMKESGMWKSLSWEYRLLKKTEMTVAKNAAAILTATQKMIDNLEQAGIKGKMIRVPSCVDLDLFSYSPIDRQEVRKVLGLKNDEILLVYLGKFEGMYWGEELFQLFHAFETSGKYQYKYLILSIDDKATILSLNKSFSQPKKLIIKNLLRSEVPKYLSAADCGICGIKNIPSRRYSSPIKNGEYWACGLPVIIPRGISDDYLLAEENDIGIVLSDCSEDSFRKVVEIFEEKYTSESWMDIRKRATDFVFRDRNVEHYKSKYHALFNSF